MCQLTPPSSARSGPTARARVRARQITHTEARAGPQQPSDGLRRVVLESHNADFPRQPTEPAASSHPGRPRPRTPQGPNKARNAQRVTRPCFQLSKACAGGSSRPPPGAACVLMGRGRPGASLVPSRHPHAARAGGNQLLVARAPRSSAASPHPARWRGVPAVKMDGALKARLSVNACILQVEGGSACVDDAL